jgi:hypothetical protein
MSKENKHSFSNLFSMFQSYEENQNKILPSQATTNSFSYTLCPEEKNEFNVQSLLNECNLNSVKSNIQDKSMTIINNEIMEAINGLDFTFLKEASPESSLEENRMFSEEIKKELCKKMVGFQYVYQLDDLILGRTLKMIRIEDAKFCFPGVLLNIRFTNNGTVLLCKIPPKGRILNYSFDKYLIFQKLNKDEEMILSLQDWMASP